jgi:Ankyrin repeats (many copies)
VIERRINASRSAKLTSLVRYPLIGRCFAWRRYGLTVADDARLMTLVWAIAQDDRGRVSELLASAPDLALARFALGATRQAAEEYFLEAIGHYVYGGDSALHIAAAAYDPGVVRELVGVGALVSAVNRRGAQPLHYAVDGSPGSARWNPVAQVETVFCLVELGADPSAADKNGTTPLHRAVRNRCAAAVRALLDVGADPHADNGRGSTAVQLARWTTGRPGSGSAEARAQQEEIVQLVRASGGR